MNDTHRSTGGARSPRWTHETRFASLTALSALSLGTVEAGQTLGTGGAGLAHWSRISLRSLLSGKTTLALRSSNARRSKRTWEALDTLLALRTSLAHHAICTGLARRTWWTWVSLFCWLSRWTWGTHDTLRTLVTLATWGTFRTGSSNASPLSFLSGQTNCTATARKTLRTRRCC